MSVRSIVCLSLLASLPALGGEKIEPVECHTERWAKLERLEHPDQTHMVQEKFLPLIEHHDPEIKNAFGRGDPPSSQVLLHYAAGWDQATNPVPVLLVHGAGLTANHCYADHPIEQPGEGLAACLARSGRAVFALTFAHPHGDNYLQAEALALALARVKEVTGKKQVDLVAHSKGGMASRIYLSDAGPEWATRYRGDVRRYVMLGTPNGGIDVSFAYPNLNYWILEKHSPAPLSWLDGVYYGVRKDFTAQSIYKVGGAFPGQSQMLRRWDGRYGKTPSKGQFDVETTYEGGKGLVSTSLGIDVAIEEGGRVIERLARKGIAPGVQLCVLAGTQPWVVGLVGERRGPSDGLLLVASVRDLAPLTQRGAKVIKNDLRMWNHLALVYEPAANDWVVEALDQE